MSGTVTVSEWSGVAVASLVAAVSCIMAAAASGGR